MAVAFDATASQVADTSSDITWAHPGATSPTNYLAIVGLTVWDIVTTPITTMTFGGQAMTLIQSVNIPTYNIYSRLYGLINPPTGTQTVEVKTTAGPLNTLVGGSITFTGADQVTGWHNNTSTSSGAATSLSLVVTSAVGEMTVSNLTAYIISGTTYTTNQTQRWMNNNAHGPDVIVGGGDTAPGAATVTHTWSTAGTNHGMAIAGLSIIAAAVGATTLPIFVLC